MANDAGPERTDDLPFVPYDSANSLTADEFPGPVFHYTNQAGFLGIVRDKAIWATDLRYLNDSREYLVGFERIFAELLTRTASNPPLARIVGSALGRNRIENAVGVSVASFSLAQDDLSQWRAYGGGTGGICLGFEPRELARRIHYTGSRLGAVRYTEQEQSDIVDKVCAAILVGANAVLSSKTSESFFSGRCGLTVQLACALMKHHKFASEREWRMVVWSKLPPYVNAAVRPGRSMMIPYLSVQLDTVFNSQTNKFDLGAKLPLDTIWLGPTPHPQLAMRAASVALSTASELADLRVSEVPFRDW